MIINTLQLDINNLRKNNLNVATFFYHKNLFFV